MQNLKNKLKKHGGFTLVEMLIVVAIIAILIAVSIPLVSSSLEQTKHATDAANERAAKAEIMLQFLAGDNAKVDVGESGTAVNQIEEDTIYYYNAAKGMIADKTSNSGKAYGQHGKHRNCFLAMSIKDSVVTMQWTDKDITALTEKELCGSENNASDCEAAKDEP